MQLAVQTFGRARDVPVAWIYAKRSIDVSVSLALLLILTPIIAIAAVAIAVVTGGTPFFAHERVGMNGRRFRMYKLRTMVSGADAMREDIRHLNEADGPVFKIRDDPRLHPLGGILRRTSIDELPNLINVVIGDMSLVGPRPLPPSEVAQLDAWALRRLNVPQGVTCLWQISGRSTTTFAQWMDLDNRYVDEWTPLGDLAILLKTIPAVLCRKGAH
jgi:lipopolysaccharide/colanic/teichoic acid biosynthesis glycosyltransferase